MIELPVATLAATFAGAAAVTFALTPAVAALARRLGVLDLPGGRHAHVGPVPRIGGLAVFGGLAVAALVYGLTFGWEQFRWTQHQLLAFLLPCLLVFTVGVVDDVRGLGPATKLLGQTVAAAFLIQAGYVFEHLANPFGAPLELGLLAFPVTLLWFVAVTNAFNLIDGIDGLLATVSIAALLGCAAISLHGERDALTILSLAMAGALTGFLPWNWHPARVFLGDSGSLVIGLAVAALSIKVCRNPGTPLAPQGTQALHVPFLLCALPLIEMTLTVARRYLSGSPISVGDRSHIHHVLLNKGLSVPRAAASLALIALLFSATAVLSRSWRREVVLAWLVVLFVSALIGLRWLGYVELQVLLDRCKGFLSRSRRTTVPQAVAIARTGETLSKARSLSEVDASLRLLVEQAGFEYVALEVDVELQEVMGVARRVARPPSDVDGLIRGDDPRLLLGIAAAASDPAWEVPRPMLLVSLPLPLYEGRFARLLCLSVRDPSRPTPQATDLETYIASALMDALRRLALRPAQLERPA